MKITYFTAKINFFGGINFANSISDNAQVFYSIEHMPGTRYVRAQYHYSNLSAFYFLKFSLKNQ